MANPSLQIGNSNWAIKEDNLLGYSTAGTRFVPQPITMTRASAGTRVNSAGLVETVELLGSDLITNGDFLSDIDGWSNNLVGSVPDIAWNDGKARITNTTGSSYNTGLNTTNDPFNGLTGVVKVTGNIQIISGSAGTWTAREHYGTTASFVLDASGNFEVILSLDGTSDDLALYTYASNLVFDIDNIVAKEVTKNNLARVDYDGTASSLLVEPQRTNLVTYSDPTSNEGAAGNIAYETFSWGLGTLIENSVYYADNTVTRFRRLGGSLVASTYYAFSFYCIKDDLSAPTFALGINDDFIVKLNGLQVSQSLDEVEIKDKGNGVYFITIASDRGTGSINVIEKTAANTSIGFRVSGFQIEAGSYATSYIPTDGSTVTRVQDQYEKTGISNLINSTEGVLFLEMAALYDGSSIRLIGLNDGSDLNRVFFYFRDSSGTNPNRVRTEVISGGSSQYSSYNTIPNSGSLLDFNKIAVKWKVNDIAIWINGTEVDTDTSALAPIGLNSLDFSTASGSLPFSGKVKQLQVFKTALTDTELATLTTI
jgi:hypothetical protein